MNRKLKNSLTVFVLALSVVFIAAGFFKQRKVYEQTADEFGIRNYNRIKDYQLVIDTTFGGVTRKGDKLYSTYNRDEQRGKRKCPT